MEEIFKVIRQDGKTVEFILDEDGLLNWEVRKDGESYILVVTNDYRDDEGNIFNDEHVVGVYDTASDAHEDGESMEESGIVHYTKITAREYLQSNGEVVTPADSRNLKGLTALQYLNEESADED